VEQDFKQTQVPLHWSSPLLWNAEPFNVRP